MRLDGSLRVLQGFSSRSSTLHTISCKTRAARRRLASRAREEVIVYAAWCVHRLRAVFHLWFCTSPVFAKACPSFYAALQFHSGPDFTWALFEGMFQQFRASFSPGPSLSHLGSSPKHVPILFHSQPQRHADCYFRLASHIVDGSVRLRSSAGGLYGDITSVPVSGRDDVRGRVGQFPQASMAQEECEAVSVHWFFTPNEAHASFPHEIRGLETRMQLRMKLRAGTQPVPLVTGVQLRVRISGSDRRKKESQAAS